MHEFRRSTLALPLSRRLCVSVPIRCQDQLVDGAWLAFGMAAVLHHQEVCLWPSPMQLPSCGGRTDHVVAALDDRARDDVPDSSDAVQQLPLGLEEPAVGEVLNTYTRVIR